MDIGVTHVGVEPTSLENGLEFSVYPNPSNGPVNISLNLETSSPVRIVVHDNNGSLVDVVYSGYLGQGNHKFQWMADASGGIYHFSIESNNTINTKKVIIKR